MTKSQTGPPKKNTVLRQQKKGSVANARNEKTDFSFACHEHRGEPVRVGPYTVLAGGTKDLVSEDLEKADLLVPLTTRGTPFSFGRRYEVLCATMVDYSGVPEGWREFLEGIIIPELAIGRRLLVYCMGSHGRTGTFLASLIALLESAKETPDPIQAVRERHCIKAVETRAQAEAIFALRGEKLPKKYEKEFGSFFSLGLREKK